MEKPNYTTVCADILTRYGVAIPYHTIHFVIASLGSLVLTGKPMHLSSSLPRRQNMFLLTGFIFTWTHPTHSVDGQFTRRPSVFAVKGQAQDGFALFLHDGPRSNSENLLGWTPSTPKHSTDLLWHDASSSLTGLFRSTIYRRRICTTWMRRGVNETLSMCTLIQIPGCAKIHGLKDYSMLINGRLALTKTLMALTLTLPYYPKHIPLPTYNFPTPFLCPLMSQMSSCQLLQFLGPLKSLNHTISKRTGRLYAIVDIAYKPQLLYSKYDPMYMHTTKCKCNIIIVDYM